jgi:hypothetical protein
MFELQCKLRAGQPSYLKAWLKDIVAAATARERVGVVVWKETGAGKPDDNALVVMRWKDFVALHGESHICGTCAGSTAHESWSCVCAAPETVA